MTELTSVHVYQSLTKREKYLQLFKLLLPFALWLFLMRDLALGRSIITGDTFSFYATVKFFFSNLAHGIYPLWNPFVVFGMPADIDMRCIGEFNPFLYLIPALNTLGLNFYHAFLVYLAAYFFVGLLGFYLLAKAILKNPLAAYLAYLILMFSSLSMTMFSQVNMLLLFVPAVWCVYFAVEWMRNWEKRYFLGLVFALMVIFTTYLPLYILTVFLILGLFWAVIYFKEIKARLTGAFGFCHRYLGLKVFCLLALLISLISPVLSYRAAMSQDMVLPTRHFDAASISKGGLAMRYEDLNAGGITTKMSGEDLFFNLDRIAYDNDGFVFVPLFAVLFLCVAAFSKITRLSALLFSAGFFLFLLALGNAGGLHKFLFDHIFFFPMLRNLYYFLPFILALLVLFASEQLQALLAYNLTTNRSRLLFFGWIVIVHSGFLAYFSRSDNVILSSYLTVLLSFIGFTLFEIGWFERRKNIWAGFLTVLILLQPAQVLFSYNKNASVYKSEYIQKGIADNNSAARFSFLHPGFLPSVNTQSDVDSYNYYRLALTDSPGFVTYHYGYPTRYAYPLLRLGVDSKIQSYVKHKFVIYDNAAAQKDISEDPKALKESLSKNKGAFLDGDRADFKVAGFDVNGVKISTNFNTEKFLVYNDSFHSHWKAFINGNEAAITRASLAFKGVVLPAGKNMVEFRFMPFGGERLYFFILAFFFVFFAYVIFAFVRRV